MTTAVEGISKSELFVRHTKNISYRNSWKWKIDENEKLFYFAQKVTSRIGCISEEIDISNEIFKQKELKQIELENELIFIWDELHKRYIHWWYQCWIFDVVTPLKSTLTEPSVSLSGTVRIEEIRRIQNITEEIKPACAKTSSLCGICVDKARIAVQVVCNELYQHKYYLFKEKQLNSIDIGAFLLVTQ